ncbi:MAG TPA: nucleotide exchange factor GrpE [Gemmataceae bacterium]|nr:nucleotide exchange factor GrpE [Gemmataceae bacterium]
MPEPAPPGVAANAAGNHPEALTPAAVEAVLADFRAWLRALPAAAAPPPPSAAEPVDLHALLSQFVALRHEVTLQTRAARAQQEHNAETLRHLSESLELLEQAAPGGEAARPLLKTLVDLYDALSLARREVQRVQEAVLPVLDQLTAVEGPPEESAGDGSAEEAAPAGRPSWLARLFGRERAPSNPTDRGRRRQAGEAAGRVRAFLDSVITGYTMSVQRLDRALRQHGLEPIASAGHPFDPERMEVLEVVHDSGRPANEVVDEVRRGYLWKGRLFRPAQVRVAKS